MSTERASRRARARRRRGRLFAASFAVVIAALAGLVLAGAAASTAQGPRATAVQVDPAAAATASGARVIVTANQSLQKVDASQVTVTPAADFTVDTSGRAVGIRFTLPLHDDTAYTLAIRDVSGLGGGPATTITESFTTPAIAVYMLERTASGDTITRTGLAQRDAEPIFRNAHIEDFRVTSAHLVASVRDDDGEAALVVTDLDGGDERQLELPGAGTISNLQSADRGETIGYTFSDATLSQSGGRESALFTASLKDAAADDEPTAVSVSGADTRVADWRFVPDTDSILVLTFDGRMLLSGSSGADATDLGSALAIEGIARGSATAVIERADGLFTLNLADGSQAPLTAATGIDGTLGNTTPVPGAAAATVRPYSIVDDAFRARGTTVYRVADDGTATALFSAAGGDAVLQTCVSPSGRYVAILVAPDTVSNPYDAYDLPMPGKLETHVVQIDSGDEVVALPGFDISWCQVPPS